MYESFINMNTMICGVYINKAVTKRKQKSKLLDALCCSLQYRIEWLRSQFIKKFGKEISR